MDMQAQPMEIDFALKRQNDALQVYEKKFDNFARLHDAKLMFVDTELLNDLHSAMGFFEKTYNGCNELSKKLPGIIKELGDKNVSSGGGLKGGAKEIQTLAFNEYLRELNYWKSNLVACSGIYDEDDLLARLKTETRNQGRLVVEYKKEFEDVVATATATATAAGAKIQPNKQTSQVKSMFKVGAMASASITKCLAISTRKILQYKEGLYNMELTGEYLVEYLHRALNKRPSDPAGGEGGVAVNFRTRPDLNLNTDETIQNQIKEKWAVDEQQARPTEWQCSGLGLRSKFQQHQDFLINLVTPQNMISCQKGGFMLLHSAGSGKTATAIAIASVWRQKGFMPIVVTTPGNAGERVNGVVKAEMYTSEAILNQADIFAAQFADTKEYYKSATGGEGTNEEIVAYGLKSGWLDTHTRSPTNSKSPDSFKFKRNDQILSFQKFSNDCRQNGSSTRARGLYSKHSSRIGRCKSGHFLCSKVVIMDEAHKTISSTPDAANGDYNAIRNSIWDCRTKCEQYGCIGPFVLLLTATPCPEGPVDMLYLSQLLLKKRDCRELKIDGFDPVEKVNDAAAVKSNPKAYIEPLKHKLDGMVSFLNNSGDLGKYAKMETRFYPVTLEPQISKAFKRRFKSNAKNKRNLLVYSLKNADTPGSATASQGVGQIFLKAIENVDPYQRNFFFIDSIPGHHVQKKAVLGGLMEVLKKKFGQKCYYVTDPEQLEEPRAGEPVIVLAKPQDPHRKLLAAFNKPGSRCNNIVLSQWFKEGVSLFNVQSVHIIGFIMNKSDLVQSIARAFRFCKSTALEFGKAVTVHCTYPARLSSATGEVENFRDLVSSSLESARISGEDQTDMMMDSVREVATDRYHNKQINDASLKNLKKLDEMFLRDPGPNASVGPNKLGLKQSIFAVADSAVRNFKATPKKQETVEGLNALQKYIFESMMGGAL